LFFCFIFDGNLMSQNVPWIPTPPFAEWTARRFELDYKGRFPERLWERRQSHAYQQGCVQVREDHIHPRRSADPVFDVFGICSPKVNTHVRGVLIIDFLKITLP
jgi:hypothetical protein